jgi:DNA-binding MarR family transcriptional regulator
MTLDPTAGLRQFVEDMGLRYEEEGFPPMAGRLAGWLLVCHPPHQTAAELAAALGASPGSISTVTRLLVQCGLLERIAIPGRRGAAFRIRPGASTEILRRVLGRAHAMRELLARGLELRKGEAEERLARLRDQHDFHVFLEREIPALLERYGEGRPE